MCSAQVPFELKPQLKIISFFLNGFLIHTRSDQAFQGIVVNWTQLTLCNFKLRLQTRQKNRKKI